MMDFVEQDEDVGRGVPHYVGSASLALKKMTKFEQR